MGRGIVESGLFRSERYGLEQRTTDPATTQKGEMWIRTDLAPDTNQLATLRFDAGGSVWEIPIYDVAASTTNVSKAWRVQVGGTVGFVPITDDSPTFGALKYQHNGAAYGAHDALEASAIPDSVVSRWRYEDNGNTTAVDSVGSNDGSITGATYTTSSAEGSYALDFGGVGSGDRVEVPHSSTLNITGDVSIGFYATVRSRPSDSWYGYVSKAGDASTGFAVHNGNPGLAIRLDGSTYGFSYGEIPLDTTTHIGISHDNANEETTLFVDGTKQETLPTGSLTSTNTSPLYHGVNSWSMSSVIDGVVDDPVVADGYLTESDWNSIIA